MMPEWHQLDSSSTMTEQQESTKRKTLKSSSRSFLFSTGLHVQVALMRHWHSAVGRIMATLAVKELILTKK